VKGSTGSAEAVEMVRFACPGGISKSRLTNHITRTTANFKAHIDNQTCDKMWVFDNNQIQGEKSSDSTLGRECQVPTWTNNLMIKNISRNGVCISVEPANSPRSWTKKREDVNSDIFFSDRNGLMTSIWNGIIIFRNFCFRVALHRNGEFSMQPLTSIHISY